MPIISSMTLFLTIPANSSSTAMTAPAPMKAAASTATKPVSDTVPSVMPPPKASITKAAPRLAPLLIPNIEGPARGLRNAVWSNSPLTASELPHSTAVIACGRRVCNMMYSHDAWAQSLPKRMATTSVNGMSTEPIMRFRRNIGMTAAAIIMFMRVPFFMRGICLTLLPS